MAAILGGALSLSGFLLQTFFENPIAGPFVLGISSGAKNGSSSYHDLLSWQSCKRNFLHSDHCSFLLVPPISIGFILLISKRIKLHGHPSGCWNHDWLYLFCSN